MFILRKPKSIVGSRLVDSRPTGSCYQDLANGVQDDVGNDCISDLLDNSLQDEANDGCLSLEFGVGLIGRGQLFLVPLDHLHL